MSKSKTPKDLENRLSKLDWFKYGLEALRLYGLRGLNIEPLSKFIGVTKGSFYWHFKDREDFYKGLVQYWEDELTTSVIEQIETLPLEADLRLEALTELIFKQEVGKYESDIRAWAAFDDIPARGIKRVDKQRIKHIKSLFEKMGFSKKEAEFRGRIWYLYVVGEFMVFSDKKESLKNLKEKHKFFTSK